MTDRATTRVPKIAVAGMGYWGKNLVRNFAELGALALVCDSDADREASVKSTYPGVDFSTRYETALERDDIDAIVLATPAAAHFEMAYAAISAGKDIYVEKPLALSGEDGLALVRHAAQNQKILMVGHILQYHPAVRRLKEIINEGELGRIQYIYSNRLNMGKVRTEENILWSFAPHDISVILGLLNEVPCEVDSTGGSYLSRCHHEPVSLSKRRSCSHPCELATSLQRTTSCRYRVGIHGCI
jgi:UDP-2-acetamido-3-amino-2,3-dideoxy-glucuronate N-acetyltransferase